MRIVASQVATVVKNPPANAGDIRDVGFDPWVRKIPWRSSWQSTPVFLLENPIDRGPYWATIHGVIKSWTLLKRLSTHTHLAQFRMLEILS